MAKAVMFAAPSSGQGKTSVTMGVVRHLRNRGQRVHTLKVGPDYIDRGWHAIASGAPAWNIDPWAMRHSTQHWIIDQVTSACDWLIVEGVMGLFDGAIDGTGSSADIAAAFNIPVVLVVDASKQADSIAALVTGFHRFRPDISLAGVVLNRVGSQRHAELLARALKPTGVRILATLAHNEHTTIASRHLGLFQAGESSNDNEIIDTLANSAATQFDWDTLQAIGAPHVAAHAFDPCSLRLTNATSIAIADDAAFRFSYQHFIQAWRKAGCSVTTFSPLRGDPLPPCELVYLPGGYPELHLETLCQSPTLDALRVAATQGTAIYGECGGYMLLGQSIIDANGKDYAMAGLLPHSSDFSQPKRHLGYRKITSSSALTATHNQLQGLWHGHEFHYTNALNSHYSAFDASDARNANHNAHGDINQSVFGSYLHLIDRADENKR